MTNTPDVQTCGNARLDTTREQGLFEQRSHPTTSLPLTSFGVRSTTLGVTLRGRWTGRGLNGQLRGLWVPGPLGRLLGAAAVEAEHPTQFVVEQLAKAWRQREHVQDVHRAWCQLPQASTAKVEQGCRRRARSNHFHAALGSGGARHWEKLLIS